MPTNEPKKYDSLFDFCQGVITGECGIKPSVQKLIDDGKFPDAATWAKRFLSEFDLAANTIANSKDPKHPASPQECPAGTGKKIHWKCSYSHTWTVAGANRAAGSGCPVCAGQRSWAGFNDMATTHPHLAAEWDYDKNAAAHAADDDHPATPQDCLAGAHKKLHWKCSLGHTWSSKASHRAAGVGCPFCVGKEPWAGFNDMATTHPNLAAEWDYDKNAAAQVKDSKHPATPQDCLAGTGKNIHWKCSYGHTWVASGNSRKGGNHGCSVCSNNKVQVGVNDMATTHPHLAAEWDYDKNAAAKAEDPKHPATPQECTAGTNRIIHWKCSLGHTWSAVGNSRAGGNGCSSCSQGIGVSGTVSLVQQMIDNNTWRYVDPATRFFILRAAGATAANRDRVIKKIAATTLPKGATKEEIAEAVNTALEQDGLVNTDTPETEAGGDADLDVSDDFDLDTEVAGEVSYDEALPEVQAGEALEALDSIPGISADSETGRAIVTKYVHRCWDDAYANGPESAREHVESADISGALTTAIRNQFIKELDAAEQLAIPDDFSCEGIGFEPNLMQRHVAADIEKRRRVGNWSGTGTGKTASAVLSSRVIGAKHTIILCPNATVGKWEEDIKAAVPTAKVITTLDAYQGDISGPVYWVLNNEKLQQHDSEPKAKKIVETHRIDLVVMDEVHNFKVASTNLETMSRRRTTLEGICAEASENNPDLAVLGMSATPVINNLVEAKSLIELITGKKHDDLDTRSTVNNCLAVHMQLVLLGSRQMPNHPITVRDNFNLEVELPDDIVDEIKGLGKRPHPAHIERVLTGFRAPAIADYLAERLEEEGEAFRPTIVYTEYKDGIIEVLREAIEEKGISVAEHHGDDHTGKDRFIERDAQVLICTSAIATGVDGLQKVCNRMIVNALPWTDAQYTQLKGRIVRQGSNFECVDLIRVVTSWDSGSEEEDGVWSWDAGRHRRVEWKKGLADAAVDGVIPEAEHISPTATRDHLMQWFDRLANKGEITIERPTIKVPLSSEELERAVGCRQLSEFSELNRIWNTSKSSTTHSKLAADPTEWNMYHTLYREARATWEVVPAKWVADQLSGTLRSQRVADLGCGERLLEHYLGADTIHEVVCFDHVAVDDTVIACDVTDIGEDLAKSKSFDRVVLCLAIMAKNQSDYFAEAARLLDNGGTLYMVETNSHIGENQDKFSQMAYDAGFGTPTIEKLGDKFWTLTAHKR